MPAEMHADILPCILSEVLAGRLRFHKPEEKLEVSIADDRIGLGACVNRWRAGTTTGALHWLPEGPVLSLEWPDHSGPRRRGLADTKTADHRKINDAAPTA